MLVNKRNKKVLARQVMDCESFSSKLRGLMFRRKFPGDALLFYLDDESRSDAAIHMLFVFFPIDVLWLDEEFKIVDLREGVMPFTPFVAPKKAAKYVVELPEGVIKRTKTKVGDLVGKK